MTPKYVIFHTINETYLAWTKDGPVWHKEWKHVTKWPSQYKAKQFIKLHGFEDCKAQLVLSKKVDSEDSSSAIVEA